MRRYLLGGVLMLLGAALLWSAFGPDWQIVRTPLAVPADLKSFYPALGFERLEASEAKTGKRLMQYLVHYQGAGGTLRQALLPAPGSAKWRAWMEVGEVLRGLEEPKAWVIAWWDNGQRVDFLSGRTVWVLKPPKEAFAPRERELWQALSGGFEESEKLAQLAAWWVKESSQTLAELAALPTPTYLLVSSEDLAHLDEIERLTGKKLPLEAKLFPRADFHTQIAQVKRWSQGKSYLPQSVPGGVVAWRVTEEPGSFLLSLLPFVPPLTPKAGRLPLAQIYQSPGGYLRLYRLNFDPGAASDRRWLLH